MKRLFVLVILLMLTGCSEDIHYSAFKFGISSTAYSACADLEFAKIQEETVYRNVPKEQRGEFEEEMAAAEFKCTTVQDLISSLSQTHEKLETGYRIPKTKYLFDIQTSTGFSTAIGLFGNEEQCQNSRQGLLEVNYDLSGCYSRRVFWNSVWR